MHDAPEISVIVPLYRCAPYIGELHRRLTATLQSMSVSYEIILINDGSPEEDWRIVKGLAAEDDNVVGVNLSRNFGQHHAITAGLDLCRGEWTVVMDGDLQDRPEELPRLYAESCAGFEVVVARRKERQDSWLKRAGSRLFYRLLDYFTDEVADESIANYGIYSRQVVNQLRSMREQTRSFPLSVKWLGFEAVKVDVEHATRESGGSSYSLSRRINLGLDIIIARSNRPLHLSIKFGFLLAFGAMLFAAYLILHFMAADTRVPGWTSLMVTLVFIGGLLFVNLGLIGVYLGKIYNEVKGRPLYVISETVNYRQC